MKIGIVGLPNVGKSTLFNAFLKRQQALSANYPFATIDPNIGVVDVLDTRLDRLAEIIQKNEKINPPKVYANIEFVDIAGLVKGASKGEGLGNQFLANIREVDMILHVVRDFSDSNVIREHSKDPDTDSDVINSELIIKDLESVDKRLKAIGNDPSKRKEADILAKYKAHLDSGKLAISLRDQVDKNDYLEFIRPLFLLTDKEMIYVFNVDENDERLRGGSYEALDYKGNLTVCINAKLESELSALDLSDRMEYLKELGISIAGIDKISRICFQKLSLITFLTAGTKEVRAWQIREGTTADQAAGTIHTDFEKNFIRAEVVNFEDYSKYEGKLGAKEAGKLRLEGRGYIVKDGDVVEFKIGA